MDILIVRDGGASKIPKTVDGMAAVSALRASGFEVEVIGGEPVEEVAEAPAVEPESAADAEPPEAPAEG